MFYNNGTVQLHVSGMFCSSQATRGSPVPDFPSFPIKVVQPVYQKFPLGSVKPLGWMRDQLELAADGLAGHMFEFYRFVHDARWLGGSTEYSILDEASPYWFNGIVPLAFALDDERLLAQVRYYLDYVLDHQQADGWLGFETTRQSRGLWARCLLLLGLMVSSIWIASFGLLFPFASPPFEAMGLCLQTDELYRHYVHPVERKASHRDTKKNPKRNTTGNR